MALRAAQIVRLQRTTQLPASTTPGIRKTKTDFSGVFDKVRQTGGDLHAELGAMREKILSGKTFSNQELLYYQVRAGEFGMRVELISKLAESMSSTLKRFQQGNG